MKYFVLIIFAICMMTIGADAQCPMCRMAAESNLQNGGTEGIGLNKGILYIFVMPYLIVFILGFIWWKNKKIIIDDQD